MPTLVVCGGQDDDNGSAEELANVLPNARFEEVPGTHMSSVTKPQLGEAIARFLSSYASQGRRCDEQSSPRELDCSASLAMTSAGCR